MINFIKEQLAIWKLKKSIREFTRPDREFLESARIKFVTLAQQHGGVGVRAKHPRVWKYATVAIVAILAMTSGMAVFADASNVPVTHPLYNLKRLSETVRLEVSLPEQRLKLHEVFVQRRLEEITDLDMEEHRILIQTRPAVVRGSITSASSGVNLTPRQIRIKKLDSDFQKEAESVLDQTNKLPLRKDVDIRICKEITNAVNRWPASASSQLTNRLNIRCAEAVKNRVN